MDKEENLYCFDKEEEDEEFKNEIPKASGSFFSSGHKKKITRGSTTRKSPSADSKQKTQKKDKVKESYIIDNFYMPFMKKKSYDIKINNNLLKIKDDTKSSAFYSHHIKKKNSEIKNIGNELIIYQNPCNNNYIKKYALIYLF